MLKSVYKVDKVYGVKNSFEGYYENKKNPSSIIELETNMIETIHHHGGCFLGLKKTEFFIDKIIDSLVERNVNQLYLIGATNTFKSAALLYEEIKRRKLKIGICVLLKAINKDVAIFDTCFGFESAVEETQRFIEMGYVSSKSYNNTVCKIFILIKLLSKFQVGNQDFWHQMPPELPETSTFVWFPNSHFVYMEMKVY